MKDGFSKLTKSEKIDWVIENFFNSSNDDLKILEEKGIQNLTKH